ncbi:sensor domain-containing protein [Mycobacterium sp. FLAC0960]|uniref:Sensor domain-containing protein n=1 Tax=Mycobacterium colombiense TaxID=339268 RepID=A0A329MBM3_9MYCO|nr:sensor domain-containing protein [Mycobacterium sp. FLAC0960]MDM4141831.1 sensor domain-containing protein [Mycobacterium sp. FLAC0960]RAV17465.1 sensor domain-containing protein [Mycobacterium colombiense]
MKSSFRSLAALIAVLLTAGCTETTSGTAVLAPSAGRVPPIKRVLFDGTALARLLGQPFQPYPHYSEFGGLDTLGSNWDNGRPADCIGVVHPMQRVTYASAPIQETAAEMWVHKGDSVKVDSVEQGIVELRTVADADALFVKFTAQWQRCDGTTLMVEPIDAWGADAISDVRVSDSVVAATVSRGSGPHDGLNAIPEARALGVKGPYLVEVRVEFRPFYGPGDAGNADINTTAIDLTHALMDKLNARG